MITLYVGETYHLRFKCQNVTTSRTVRVVDEDDEFYYVNTGWLKSTPIPKKGILQIEKTPPERGFFMP